MLVFLFPHFSPFQKKLLFVRESTFAMFFFAQYITNLDLVQDFKTLIAKWMDGENFRLFLDQIYSANLQPIFYR